MRKIRSASLKIGVVLKNELKSLINLYPIVAPNNTTYPFCVYRRTGLNVSNTKDIFNFEDSVLIELNIVSQSYEESLEKAINIKMFLEHLRGFYSTTKEEKINVNNVTMIDSSEDYNGDAYIQTMSFKIDIENNGDENKFEVI